MINLLETFWRTNPAKGIDLHVTRSIFVHAADEE
jgi:hypothetical protein